MLLASCGREASLGSGSDRAGHCSGLRTSGLGENPKCVLPKAEVFIPNKLYSVQDPNESLKASDC